MRRFVSSLGLFVSTATLAIGLTSGASAQSAPPAVPAADDYHDAPSADLIVTAPYQRSTDDVLSGTTVLSGEELTREIRTTIGETLARQPGVSATSFGPNASRPVLRGLQGERVRILTDGIGSFDVSNTSVDHAVAINPLTADRIEVLRGPAALLFGSSAIGGVVNVIDSRIPRRVPEEAVHIDALATYGTAANERSGAASLDVPLGTRVVAHVDGSYTRTGDLRTGGFILSPQLRAAAAASGDPDVAALANLRGDLPNSAARTWEVAGGAAVITEGGNLGFSVSHLDSLYGVPIRYSVDPAVEGEAVRLDIRQNRADFRAEVETGDGFIERLRFRSGAADYRHNEIDETGAIGTTFLNESLEARLELVQAQRGGWQGASGIQYYARDLNVIGAEKFVPRSDTSQYGLFTLQSVDFGAFRAEGGARFEHTSVNARADATLGNPASIRTFDAYSGSLGASVALADNVRLGLNATHTERAPGAEELFANGPHAGTQAFEVGNPNFVKERSNGVEATLHASGDGYTLSLSGYYTAFSDFISEQPTGAVQDDLPVFQFAQADAAFYGFEAQASARVARLGSTSVTVDGIADYTHAHIDGFGAAPRIPPLRLLGGVSADGPVFGLRAEVEHSFKQNRITTFETPTAAFTLVNASLTLRPFGDANSTTLSLSANNIFDVVARRHASFLKDFAPLGGRDIRVTARLTF